MSLLILITFMLTETAYKSIKITLLEKKKVQWGSILYSVEPYVS